MTALVRYDEMCRAIEQSYRVDEVKDLRDKAMAWEAYSRLAKNIEAERQACEIRLRAERKAGELLQVMAKSGERATQGQRSRGTTFEGPTKLADLGISKGQSSRWQQLADVPQEDFEKALAADDKPTTGGIIEAHAPAPEPVERGALWLWGRLHDFESRYLDDDPAELLRTLTPTMRKEVLRIAPRVADWLNRMEEANVEISDTDAAARDYRGHADHRDDH